MTSPEFQAHLQHKVTTLCHCWRVRLRDGTVFGFTDHDRALTVAGTEFAPETGLSGSEAREREGLGIGTMEVEGALSSARITETDVLDGRYDGAVVETLLVNWREPTQFGELRRATIAKVTRADGRFVAELESLGRGLDLVSGRQVRRRCDAELGDPRCGVDLAGPELTGAGEVISFNGATAWWSPGWTAMRRVGSPTAF